MKQVTISDIDIEVIQKDIKNIHLAVYPPLGRVRIAVPLHTDDDTIRLFIISRLTWIKRQKSKFDNQERLPLIEYKERESHYFLGRRYLLNIIEENSPPKVKLKTKKYIELYIRPNTSREKYHDIMTEWYRNELKKLIPPIITKWEERLGVIVNAWKIRSMKTKWGSCNIDKRSILINLELAKKPDRCLEYIIVHEMIHLLERHHNERFLYYINTHLPNWKQLKDELNRLPVSHVDWKY